MKLSACTYQGAVVDHRGPLGRIGGGDFRAYGYWQQLLRYRVNVAQFHAAAAEP